MGKHKHAGAGSALTSNPVFLALGSLVLALLGLQLILVAYYHDRDKVDTLAKKIKDSNIAANEKVDRLSKSLNKNDNVNPHLFPPVPPLPPFSPVKNGKELTQSTLQGKATVAGVMSILNTFLLELHEKQKKLAARKANRDAVISMYVDLANQHLLPFDEAYRGRSVFTIREDDSIYVSVAAFRDHLLGQTLKNMFREAKNPQRIFVGAVVQNCFGNEYTCKTGAQVIGKDANGHDMTKVSDAPPDINGVAEFCQDDAFEKYCAAGHIRALYVNETESLGPAMARYWASKLWGGETYFVQIDSHLQFADHWDSKYIAELQAAKAYPKSILSSYPPGFGSGSSWRDTPGSRLCSCEFSSSEIEHRIIRINTGATYHGEAPAPTQIPFMAAGFFFARAEFLVDVPFDPYLPWTFMGEEIALSLRSWTSGWDMYAPRKNWIAHQYRPGRMGLPKFWGSVGRTYGRGRAFYHKIQDVFIQRLKNMVGYPEVTRQKMMEDGQEIVLTELEHYGLGTERTREAYLELAKLDMNEKKCHNLKWCNQGELL